MNPHSLLASRLRHACRRQFLSRLAMGAGSLLWAPGAFAEALTRTPSQTEGPFYPDHLPLDTDNDLLIINDSTTPALGEVTWLSGRVLGVNGSPIRNALVEIWQCDQQGVYIHSRSGGRVEKQDKNFQGFGRFLTGSSGEYLFRTIKPVAYPGRTPHIHVKVKAKGKEMLTTQFYVKGERQNERDGIWRRIAEQGLADTVTADFVSIPKSKAGELSAKLDIVLGLTPES